MGFRFRKSFKLAPGVRINLSTRGGSLSLGGRGATFNLSSRGVRSTFGIPGSGLSWTSSTNAAGTRRAASARRLGATQAAGARREAAQEREAARLARIEQAERELAQKRRAERDVVECWRELPEAPSAAQYQQALEPRPFTAEPAPQAPEPWPHRIELLRAALREGLEDPPYWWMAAAVFASLCLGNLVYLHVHRGAAPLLLALLLLASTFGPTLARPLRALWRELTHWREHWAETLRAHQAALASWQDERQSAEQSWHEREAERVAWARRLLAGDVEALGESLGDTLADLDFPFEASCRVGVFDAGHAAILLDLPEIEDTISETKRRVLRDGSVKESKRTKAERAQDYGLLATGLGLWVVRAGFAAGPTLQKLSVAAYTQRRKAGSGELRDEFVYEFEIAREAALAIDGRSVDARQLLGSLQGRIDARENGELKRIDPPSWYDELLSPASLR